MDENQPDIQTSNKRTWMIVSIILLAIVAILFFFLIKGRKTTSETSVATAAPTQKTAATLGGTITFSGLLPSESDQATVKVLFRDAHADSNTEFVSMGLNLPAQNNTPWQYNQAVMGENYEVVATLIKDGIVIETSETEEVTAPALHINLDFNLEYDELGLSASSLPKQEISGKIQINGYVPSDASVQVIESLDSQEQTWLTLAANAHQIPFTISQVAPEKNYTLYANLLDKSGKNIGKSDGQIVANTGDTQVNFVIQSQAAAPATPQPTPTPATPAPVTKAKMSGTVLVNGPMNDNSRLLILGKRPQDSDYQVWQTINSPNNDGQSWQYDQAEIGQTYNVQVALQVNEGNVGTANMLTAVAPASNLNFTVNTGLSLAAPNSQAMPEPCQRDGDKWKTRIKIPWVSGAGQYWIQVGSKENYADIYNQRISADGQNDVTIELTGFQLGVMNHVRYSYSKCRSCGSFQNFSAWSQDKTFTCE